MTANTNEYHPVIFCGAGPGDPELITVKGQKALAEADLVVYAGSLVPRQMLAWAPRARAVNSAGLNLEEIVELMASAYSSGRKVVRLHTGDPSLYGALAEQIQALEARNIPCRIIPGVTAAFAAAAALGLEYTLPEVSQSLILTRMAGRTPVPENEALATLASHKTSMAIYLSTGMLEKVAAALEPAYGPEAPCVLVYRASWPDQQVITARVEDLARRASQAGIDRQALVIVSPALEKGCVKPSHLYSRTFSHGFRNAGPEQKD